MRIPSMFSIFSCCFKDSRKRFIGGLSFPIHKATVMRLSLFMRIYGGNSVSAKHIIVSRKDLNGVIPSVLKCAPR